MKETIYQADITDTMALLHGWLVKSASTQAITWIDEKIAEINLPDFQKKFFLAFSAAPRFTGKDKLLLTGKDLKSATKIRRGWKPQNLSADQATRILFTLTIPIDDEKKYLTFLDKLFDTGGMEELIALYSALPLLPYPHSLIARAREGLRSNMKSVFESIAINNPFASDYFEEEAWNHLVLKALFVDASINEIYGIDERANQNLAGMLSHYAHERWAAGREVNPLLWRPIGKFIDSSIINDIKKLFESTNSEDRKAAALACSQSNFSAVKKLMEENTLLMNEVKAGTIHWDNLSL